MKTALTLTNPTPEELAGLRAALNFSSGFAVRRAQMLLQVAAGKTAPTIARAMHCSHPGVRNIIRAFNARGLACLEAQSSAPKSVKPIIQEPQGERLVALLHTSPRVDNRKTRLWTLSLLAEVAAETKITPRLLTGEASRQALVRLEISWRRATTWITSPDPEYAAKKRRRDRLIAWACGRPDAMSGFQDEVRCGGAAWRRPTCMRGRQTSHYGWSTRRSPKQTPTPRQLLATDCSSRRVMSRAQIRSGCAWSKAGR